MTITSSFFRICMVPLLILLVALASPAQEAAKAPVDLLFLKGNCEIGFGQPINIDPVLLGKLEASGYRVTEARDFQPLTPDVLRRFACVVWINPSPYASGFRYYMPAGWQGGLHMLTVERNAELLREYVQGGGGLLIDLSIEEIGFGVSKSHQQLLAPYGIETECAQIRDMQHAVEFDKVLKTYPRYMHWSEAIADHPATRGVHRIYYPGYSMRWDDNVTTLPLYPKDPAWVALVQAEETATVSWFRGTPYEKGHWKDAKGRPRPALAAAREYGKGRIAVTGLSHFMLYYYPYSKGPHGNGDAHWEANFGFQGGYMLEKGDGKTPSDIGKLLLNLYSWLSEPARSQHYGGYGQGGDPQLAEIPTVPVDGVNTVWAEKDPIVTGPVHPMKILVGARSAVSDGKGTPADWAKAAKAAGIDVVAFTERYESMDDAAYLAFAQECRKYSDEKVHLLPGLDIMDALGNRFLIIGKEEPIRPHLLVEREEDEPGRHLIWTGHMLLGMGDVLPVAARPEHMATVRDHGALPPQLYSHLPGIAVATYDKNGKLIDNGRAAYEWQLFNACQPIPVAIHEVTSPDDLVKTADTRLYSFVNSDTPVHAAHYFRQGNGNFGGNPMRYYISNGPVITAAEFDQWDKSPWSLRLSAQSNSPINNVILRDQRGLYRQFNPQKDKFEIKIYGDLGAQQWFLTEVTDVKGGTAILSPMRTLPERNFIRCGDRQNWFGVLHISLISYTGRLQYLPKTGFEPALSLPGIELPAQLAPKLYLTFAGPGYVVTDYHIDSTLVPGGRPTGADNSPMFNVLPITEFEARYRYEFHMSDITRTVTPDSVIQRVSVMTKKNLKARGSVWPVIGQVAAAHAGDHPAGTVLEDLLLLTPLRVDAKGQLGWPCTDGQAVPANTRFEAAVAPIDGKNAAAITASMGLTGVPPYKLTIDQGAVTQTTMETQIQASKYGIHGSIVGGEMPRWWRGSIKQIPLRIHGLNSRWPCGVWYGDKGEIKEFGILDEVGMALLRVNTDTNFYAGNLLMSDHAELFLSFTEPWTANTCGIEIHNPTGKTVTARIFSAPSVSGRIVIDRQFTVPAGQSIEITVPAP